MGISDWQPFVCEHILDKEQNLQILEFGVGNGTEMFLDKGNTVHSIEILTSTHDRSWFDAMTEKYADRSWRGSFVQLEGEIDEIERTERIPGLYDIQKSPMIQEALRPIVTPFFQEQAYDFIFVDPGIHLRPEILHLAFETNTKYIAVHDTRQGFNHYGWDYLQVPSNYQGIISGDGMGTSIFVRTD
jgi:hypothetical protein